MAPKNKQKNLKHPQNTVTPHSGRNEFSYKLLYKSYFSMMYATNCKQLIYFSNVKFSIFTFI